MRAPLFPLLAIALFAAASIVRADDASDALKAAKAGAAAGPNAAGAPVDETKPLEGDEPELSGSAEKIRRKLLAAALPKVQDLIQAITTGSTGIVASSKTGKPVKLRPDTDPTLLATMRAAYQHLGVRPNGDDWLNDKKDKETLDTLTTAARLMAENLAKTLPKRKTLVPAGDAVARNWGSHVQLYPDFWVAHKEPYPSEMCAGIILMHEYFHLLVVNPEEKRPGRTQLVFHGEILGTPKNKFPPDTPAYGLADAYSLTSFTVTVGNGSLIECVPGWKPGT